jgi:hypothetical protein
MAIGMTTNLRDLPQIPAGTVVDISSNADWTDQLFVPQPGFASAPITLTGALAGSTTFTVASPGGALPDMLVFGPGVAPGALVSEVSSDTITLSDPATITAPAATLTFYPPPLDLTGIKFSSAVRLTAMSTQVLLLASTDLGTMTNGGVGGQFGWNVPAAAVLAAAWPRTLAAQGVLSCVADVIAEDASGARLNLCADGGPIALNINLSITR